jgi:protein-L-isoaspartate(D-aspartate) O-methyltransferase
MNIEQARFNMIEQQIRPWKVLDPQVLDLLSSIPREQFVPEAYQGLAFADIAIPLGNNRFMMHPREEGRLLQAIKPNSSEKVLVINTGTGYVTALLASIAGKVTAIDSNEEFIETTAKNLDALNITNVTLNCSDTNLGDKASAPYDAIVILGSMQVMSEIIKGQLAVGGRMFCIIGKEPTMEALIVNQVTENEWQEEGLFETSVPALENSPEAEKFRF